MEKRDNKKQGKTVLERCSLNLSPTSTISTVAPLQGEEKRSLPSASLRASKSSGQLEC